MYQYVKSLFSAGAAANVATAGRDRVGVPTAVGGPTSEAADRIERLQRWSRSHSAWRQDIYQQLGSHWRAKKGWGEAIKIILKQAERRQPRSPATRILAEWDERVRGAGVNFADVIAGFVPPLEQVILACAPNEKGLDLAVQTIQDALDAKAFRSTVLLYPLILVTVFVITETAMGYFVLPGAMALSGKTPVWGALLVKASQLCWAPLIPLAIYIIGVRLLRDVWVGDRRWWADNHLWPFKSWRLDESEKFLLAWAALWDTETMAELSIANRIGTYGSAWLAARVSPVALHLASGKSLGTSLYLAGDFPTPEIIDSILSFERHPADLARNMRVVAETMRKRRKMSDSRFYTFCGYGIMFLTMLLNLGVAIAVLSQLDLQEIMDGLRQGLG